MQAVSIGTYCFIHCSSEIKNHLNNNTHPILCAAWILHRGRFDIPLSKAPIQKTRFLRVRQYRWRWDFRLHGDMKAQLPFPFFAESSARSRNWNFKNTNHGKVRSITVYRVIWERAVSFSDDLDLYEQRSGEMELSNTSLLPLTMRGKRLWNFVRDEWVSSVRSEWN